MKVSETLTPSPKHNTTQYTWRRNITNKVFGDEWIHSLEDTPKKYERAMTKDIDLRHNLRSYLQNFKDSDNNPYTIPPSYSREQIYKLIPADDLLYLSLFDLNNISGVFSWGRIHLDMFKHEFQNYLSVNDFPDDLWNWVVDGHPWSSFQYPEKVSRADEKKLQEPSFRQKLFASHQQRGLSRLSDSVCITKPILYFWVLIC